MTTKVSAEIAIVGAGVIGLAIALRLAAAGRHVVVVDRDKPGGGASFGNAGAIAPYGCAPIGNPDVLTGLPGLLFSSTSPLAVSPAYLPRLTPWLVRFLWQSLPAQARRNGQALASLLREAWPAWRELSAEAATDDLFRRTGCLYVYRDGAGGSHRDWAAKLREELGVAQQHLTAGEVAALEPGLPKVAGGLLFPEGAYILDPQALTQRMVAAFEQRGGEIHRAQIDRLEPPGDRAARLSGPRMLVEARRIVVAAGAWSRPLALQAGDAIPLDTERGYHIEFAMKDCPITRPVSPIELGFYMTPMTGRLRVAGTVELAGLSAPLNPRRIAYLERGARSVFPDLESPCGQWLGFRPSMPDSLPVIGPSARSPNVIYAFGHGHLGMTLAGVTSQLVGRLFESNNANAEDSPFRATRFA
jgi:D-amino-acid dehydrogenase